MESNQQTNNENLNESLTSFESFWKSIKNHILAIVIIFALFISAGITFTIVETPEYKSTGTMMVEYNKSDDDLSSSYYVLSENISNTFVVFIQEYVVLNEVSEQTGYSIEHLQKKLTVTNKELILSLSFRDSDPQKAQAVLDCIMQKSIEIANSTTLDGDAKFGILNNNLKQLSPATKSVRVSKVLRNMLIAVAAGLIVSAIYVVVREKIDNHFNSSEEIEQTLGISVIASIPYYNIDEEKNASNEKHLIKRSKNKEAQNND